MADKIAKLVCVEVDGKAGQSNKFYNLTLKEGSSIIDVEYGRVQKTSIKESYPADMWDKKYREKLKKGYKDVTDLYVEIEATPNTDGSTKTVAEIQDTVVKRLFDQLQAYANKSIQQNYTVTQTAVSQKMVDAAQAALDKLAGEVKIGADKNALNKHLLELYMIIPRQMKNVKDHLFQEDISKTSLPAALTLLSNEQATLDVMAGQVAQLKATKEIESKTNTKEAVKETVTILETMGLECSVVTDQKELDIIHDMLNDLKRKGQQDNRKIFKQAFRVVNKKTQVRFDANLKTAVNKQCRLLWHGSRNANYLSICQTGLEIRPAANGHAFGRGVYFAQHSGKSLNYSDYRGSYRSYTGGSSSQAFLLLFNVNVGSQKIVHNTGNYNLKDLRKEGHDSTWAQATSSSYIAYDEYIIYDASQCTIQYLIEIES